MSAKLFAYRKNYSSQHVLLCLIKNWRRCLDENLDLSKAFNCLSHELLIAKLDVYGFYENTIRLVYSYLKNRKQSVKIKGSLSALKRILSMSLRVLYLDQYYSRSSLTIFSTLWVRIIFTISQTTTLSLIMHLH